MRHLFLCALGTGLLIACGQPDPSFVEHKTINEHDVEGEEFASQDAVAVEVNGSTGDEPIIRPTVGDDGDEASDSSGNGTDNQDDNLDIDSGLTGDGLEIPGDPDSKDNKEEIIVDDPPADDPPANDPPGEEIAANDPPSNDPPANDPPVNDPPANDPPSNDPPANDPPDEEIAENDPPAEDPPANDPPKEDPPPPTVEEVIISCATTTHIIEEKQVSFPARKDCNWGSKATDDMGTTYEVLSANGNLSIKNGWIRAREDQTVSMSLPAGAILCGMELQSHTDTIHFDDYFALRLDKYVVAASKVLTEALEKDDDAHYVWNWEKIRGDGSSATGTAMVDLGKYCGTGDCDLPNHDKPGKFAVNFSLEENSDMQTEQNAALFAKLAGKSTIEMTATATGDNDGGDCDHSGGEFTAKLKYVIKK